MKISGIIIEPRKKQFLRSQKLLYSFLVSIDHLYLALFLILLHWLNASHVYSRVLTQAYVHHINYNDFLPLMFERDLNYRYPLRGHKEEKKEKTKMRKRRREREREGGGKDRDRRNEIG